MQNKIINRPSITDFKEPELFLKEMLRYRKQTDKKFSIVNETKNLRKISPTLVSLILSSQRKITLDRVDEFAKLLNLNFSEKSYLKNWLDSKSAPKILNKQNHPSVRNKTSTHILNDWINLYVKDQFEISEVQRDPSIIYKLLANIAPPSRIKKSLEFLLKYGYLRKKIDGSIVLDTPLTVTEPLVSNQKIRKFHKKALKLAQQNMDIYPTTERFANTATIALTAEKYQELLNLITDFTEKFKDFSEAASNELTSKSKLKNQTGEVNKYSAEEEKAISKEIQVYQLIINLSPAGGKAND